jgi:hypothetical protein
MDQPKTSIWSDRWVIVIDRINCTECGASQFIMERDCDFVHVTICSRVGPGQRPYIELLEKLKKRPNIPPVRKP